VGRFIGDNVSIFWRVFIGVTVGAVVFIAVDTVTYGIFPAVSFAVGGLAAWLVARR
jgi:hypothetical protein